MALTVKKVDVWAGAVLDRPGSLSKKLAVLTAGGANLQFVMARRSPDKPGMGVVFVTGVQGARQMKAAKEAGLIRTKTLASLRVEGRDRKGLGAMVTATLAEKGVNLRALSAAVVGGTLIAYLALDSTADANKAARALRGL
jgi:hypothetical protein